MLMWNSIGLPQEFSWEIFFRLSVTNLSSWFLTKQILENVNLPLPKWTIIDKVAFAHLVWSQLVIVYIIYIGTLVYFSEPKDTGFGNWENWQNRVYAVDDNTTYLAHVP